MREKSANVTIAIEKTEVGFTHMIHSSVSRVLIKDVNKNKKWKRIFLR